MNKNLDLLQPYPFTKLRALLEGCSTSPDYESISLAIGEPQHEPPAFVLDTIKQGLSSINKYPTTQGIDDLRKSISGWIEKRYQMPKGFIDHNSMVLPVIGSREALFATAQFIIDKSQAENNGSSPVVIIPSPFYQIYEGAAIMAGAEAVYLPCVSDNAFVADLDCVEEKVWERCQLIYVCNPSNPTGAQLSLDYYKKLLNLADRYDFVIASDECYSEIYQNENNPNPGLLDVCQKTGRKDFKRCLVFNSLSKRSNLAGMRSGFVAGDPDLIRAFLLYRTYHGCSMSLHHQVASIAAWNDETHVQENRKAYRKKLVDAVKGLKAVLEVEVPTGGFCLWAKIPVEKFNGCDETFAKALYSERGVTVLPGRYLARTINGFNPGNGYLRMAMVHNAEICNEAVERIVDLLQK